MISRAKRKGSDRCRPTDPSHKRKIGQATCGGPNRNRRMWQPMCASCMSPLFDQAYETKHEAVLHTSADQAISQTYPIAVTGLPEMTNDQPLEKVIPFLASGNVLVTNSFHGMH